MNIHKIKIRKIFPVVVPIIIGMALLSTFSINKIQKILIDQAYFKLTTSRDMKKQQISDLFNRIITDVEILAKSQSIKNLANSSTHSNIYLNRQHKEFLENYSEKYNYLDIVIIDNMGIIKYTQSDTLKIGDNLNNGYLKDSHLYEIWQKVRGSKKTRFIDMKPDKSFGGKNIMFVGTPIYINDTFKGVLIFQISNRDISKIINFKEGYENTQKDYLIGIDRIETNGEIFYSSRATIKNVQIGKCNNNVRTKALNGNTGKEIVEDCTGEKVLSAYSPLYIGQDLKWAIISEINEDVVLSLPNSIRETAVRDFISFIFIISAVIIFVAYKETKHEEESERKNRDMNEMLQIRVAEEVIKNKEHQELLFQQSKMASMGEMIGNIAHQWRQPLNALSALNVGLSMKYNSGKLKDEDVLIFKEKSNNLIQKMSDTIDDFRNFFYPNKSVEKFKVDNAIKDAINFVKDSYKINNIEIINNTTCELEITNHKNELIQVLLNIFNNSKDAIKEFNSRNGVVIIDVIILENHIKITIQDNGGGIDQEIINRVFEPYFTTKFKDEGTGIGLYMSKMIIEESMGGKLKLENRDAGVLTTIKLPIN